MRQLLLLAVWICSAGLSAGEAIPPETEALIDALTEIKEYGLGYCGTRSGSQFLPLAGTAEAGALLLNQERPVESDTLKKLVMLGPKTVPALVKHLSDSRKLKTAPLSGMMWTSFSNEYDVNRRTTKNLPLDAEKDEAEAKHHLLTVGDLCFVALGQITNRGFNAARYQPSGGIVINSPLVRESLRNAAIAEFTGFTTEAHRARLIADFTEPDYEDRRIGAYYRLAYYYPDSVEVLVLKQMAVPPYDGFAIEKFVRGVLYEEKDAAKRKALTQEYLAKRGPEWREGLLEQLFGDLDTQIASEENRISPKLEKPYFAREVLMESFDYPAGVQRKDQPYAKYWNDSERAQFIGALVHDRSRAIDRAVAKELGAIKDDDYLALACMKRLVGRGYDALIMEYCLRRKDSSKHDADELKDMLEHVRKNPSKAEPQ